MSNEKSHTPLSRATNVAAETSDDDQATTSVKSDRIVVSTNEGSRGPQKKHVKTVSSTVQKKAPATKKGGLNAATLARIKEEQLARIEAETAAAEKAEEEQRLRKEQERQEQEKQRLEEEYRLRMKEKKKGRVERQRQDGSYRTKGQRAKFRRAQVQLEAAGVHVSSRNTPGSKSLQYVETVEKGALSEGSPETNISRDTSVSLATASLEIEDPASTEEEDSAADDWENKYGDEDHIHPKPDSLATTEPEAATYAPANHGSVTTDSIDDESDRSCTSFARVRRRLERHHEVCESHRSPDVLRAPVICVLGHVDAGKTTLLDNLRRTHVQNDEAGGITQQIGATNVPLATLVERTKMCRKIISRKDDLLVPGLLIIDTPGHATFDNLRSRGSSLCDLAILVVDIMNGLQTQTRESIQLLTTKQTPFIIALNKIDLLFGWKSDKKRNVELVLKEQDQFTQNHFEKRCNEIIVQFAELGLNVALYYNNPDPNEFYSMVPTSAHSSDGMGSLIATMIESCQTTLAKRISYSNELQAAVLEVKTIHGLGTTIDVALINGSLSVGDKIVIAGQEGPIVTQVRRILIPEQNQDIRVTTQYRHQEKVSGACTIRVMAKELDKSMAGLPLFVARDHDEIQYYNAEVELLLNSALNSIQLQDSGVFVQASTLGSLEAFLKLLKSEKIPCAGVNIGPVHRKDVTRASTQLEKDVKWASILAFDVKIERDAQDYAKTLGIHVFQSDGIYTLLELFTSHQKQLLKDDQEKHRHLAVFPCKLRILPQYVFNTHDPLICGVRVEAGSIKLGTPICIPSRDCLDLGRVVSIEMNRKPVDVALKNMEVSIKIETATRDGSRVYGRHFDGNDLLVSKISRESIDVLKDYFRADMQNTDWALLLELKDIFSIA